MQNTIAGQDSYLNNVIKQGKETLKHYNTLDKKCIDLITDLADLRKNLVITRRELAQTKLKLTDKQNKIAGLGSFSKPLITPMNSTTFPTTPITGRTNEKIQQSAKLPDIPEYGEDRDSLEPWIMQLKIKLKGNKD